MMPADILFQSEKLTVSRSQITVGSASIFYPNISAVSIYEGRPFKGAAIASVISCVPLFFVFFMGSKLFGGLFPLKAMLSLLLPIGAIAALGVFFKQQTLFVTVDGRAVAIFASKDSSELQRARLAIEQAKRDTSSL